VCCSGRDSCLAAACSRLTFAGGASADPWMPVSTKPDSPSGIKSDVRGGARLPCAQYTLGVGQLQPLDSPDWNLPTVYPPPVKKGGGAPGERADWSEDRGAE
jgi:hypothetical protein